MHHYSDLVILLVTDKWNDGTEINFKVNVSELSSEQITLDINFN